MKRPFKDPIAPKEKKMEGFKEWRNKNPSYDNRSSCSISFGDDYGTGFKTPIGTKKASSIASGPIPQEAKCFSVDEVMYEDISG